MKTLKLRFLLIFFFIIISCNKKIGNPSSKSGILPNTSNIQKETGLITYNSKEPTPTVLIEDLRTNEIIYKQSLKMDFPYIKPFLINDELLYASSKKTLSLYNFVTKSLKWTFNFDNRINDFNLYNKEIVVINIDNDGIYAIDLETGHLKYSLKYTYDKCYLPDTSPYSIGFIDNILIVGGFNCNTISLYNVYDGNEILTKKIGDYSNLVSITSCGNSTFFVGINHYYKKAEIYLLNKEGKELFSSSENIETRRAPVCIDEKIYYSTYDNNAHLKVFDPKEKITKTIYQYSKVDNINGRQIVYFKKDIFWTTKNSELYKMNLETKEVLKAGDFDGFLNGVFELNNNLIFL